VPGGFLDLVLFSRGQTLVIVASKLGDRDLAGSHFSDQRVAALVGA
jgi:hypothetical protein